MTTNSKPALVDIPAVTWRVARGPDPLNFSRISVVDASLVKAGNRFDVEGGGVLYTASEPRGCFLETLARFRPTAGVLAALKDENSSFMVCGGVPADWRLRRVKAQVRCPDALPFLDVEDFRTHQFLTDAMASELVGLGFKGLDVASVRGGNRLLTRTIARWAYATTDDDGEFQYSGLRYISRLGNFECWAIFDGAPVILHDQRAIELTDPDLNWAANEFELRPF